MDKKKFNWGKRIAVVLAFVTVCSIAMIAGGQYAAKRKRDEQPQAAIENTIITPQQSNGIKLMSATIAPEDYEEYGVAATAESAMTLTATITPANATNKKVDWSVAWVNASSTWATGKTVTDYVTVTTATDGALTATVSCLKAFGEQITVKVASRENATKAASCTVDYVKKFDEADIAICAPTGGHDYTFTFEEDSLTFPGGLTDGAILNNEGIFYTDGTIFKECSVRPQIYLREDTLTTINAALGTSFIIADGGANGLQIEIDDDHPAYWTDLISVDGTGKTLTEDSENCAVLESYLANNSSLVLFTLKITVEGEYQETIKKSWDVLFDTDYLTVAVQSVAVSDSGITF